MTSELRFSRHAIDSTDEAMDCILTLRMSNDLRTVIGRIARVKGMSVGEFTRLLMWRAVDEYNLREDKDVKVMQKGDVA